MWRDCRAASTRSNPHSEAAISINLGFIAIKTVKNIAGGDYLDCLGTTGFEDRK